MKTAPRLSAAEAARLIHSGAVMMVGGFGMTGTPVHLLHALADTETRDLTYIANNIGEPGLGGGRLLRNGQIRKTIGSYFTSNPEVVAAAQRGDIDFELLPQGSMAEAIRAGGAGIGGFYTPTAAGTTLAEGAETKLINGRTICLRAGLAGRCCADPRLAGGFGRQSRLSPYRAELQQSDGDRRRPGDRRGG